MSKIKLTIDGFRALQKPTVEYDSVRFCIGDRFVRLYKDYIEVASVDIGSIYSNKGDTVTIVGLKGVLEVDLQ